MNFPDWWLGISGVFFLFAVIGQIALIVLLIRLAGVLQTVRPSLEGTAKKMESAAERVEAAAKSVQGTVDKVGGSTQVVASSVETIVSAGAKKLEPIAGYIGVAMTALQVYRELRETFGSHERHRSEEPEEDDED